MSKKTRRNDNLLLPGLEQFDTGNFENDPSLESELMAILGGGAISEKRKPKSTKKETKRVDIDKNLLNLDLNDDDDIGELDEDDPELLAELNGMLEDDEAEEVSEPIKQVVKPLQSAESVRSLENLEQQYKAAVAEAQSANDSGKARRYERSLKTIEGLLKRARKGETVDEADFPPAVRVKTDESRQAPVMPQKAPAAPSKTEENRQTAAAPQAPKPLPRPQPASHSSALDALLQRQAEYKSAALQARATDLELAKGLMIVLRQFDEVIKAVRAGAPFDLENVPPPPSEFRLSDLNSDEAVAEETVPQVSPVKQVPDVVKGLGEELKVRQAFYRESMERSKAEENQGKTRRLLRVVQQYDEAIAAFNKKQTTFAYEELLPPPGKAPLARPGPPQPAQSKPAAPLPGPPANKTVAILLQRQSQFRAAALKAKTDGELPLAKELLRQSKGIDQMIRAAEAGMPVNLSQIPSLPATGEIDRYEDYEVVDVCEIPPELLESTPGGDRKAMIGRLRAVLVEQMRLCKEYREGTIRAGDLLGSTRLAGLAQSCQMDIDGLACIAATPDAPLPHFHYEYKILAITRANADLGETEMGVEVLKATDLALPAGFSAEQLDTYVVLELPFPNDTPQSFTTETVRKTNSPQYNASTKFEVNLKSRVFHRVIKSKPLKAEIFYKRGFLKKDQLLGSCSVKMDRLETACTIHDSFDIQEGRKVIGGKLELRLRLRTALSGPQTEQVKEKWLVIDEFNKNSQRADLVDRLAAVGPIEDLGSVDVLKYEIGEMKQRLADAGQAVSASLAASVRQKIREKEEALRKQQERAQSVDGAVRLAYAQYLAKLPPQLSAEAKRQLAAGNRDKAQTVVTKRKIVETEIERLRAKK